MVQSSRPSAPVHYSILDTVVLWDKGCKSHHCCLLIGCPTCFPQPQWMPVQFFVPNLADFLMRGASSPFAWNQIFHLHLQFGLKSPTTAFSAVPSLISQDLCQWVDLSLFWPLNTPKNSWQLANQSQSTTYICSDIITTAFFHTSFFFFYFSGQCSCIYTYVMCQITARG